MLVDKPTKKVQANILELIDLINLRSRKRKRENMCYRKTYDRPDSIFTAQTFQMLTNYAVMCHGITSDEPTFVDCFFFHFCVLCSKHVER